MSLYTINFASTYGSGTYDSSSYNGATTSTSSGSSSSAGGILTNTGFDIAAAVTLACALIFTALVIKFWKKKPKQPQPKPQTGGYGSGSF